MSRWSLDPPDEDAYDIRYDGTACEDCGRPSVAWLCETCSDLRESWAAATALRIASVAKEVPAVVEVALVPVSIDTSGVVEVALVPVAKQFGQFDEKLIFEHRAIRRMAKAFLKVDLSKVKDVA